MKITANQNQILQLFKPKEILTAKEIANKLPQLDRATIYRNLNKLVKNDKLRELNIKKAITSYELIHSDKHHHKVCKICGDIKHFSIKKEDILKLIPTQDFEIENIEITITGKCKK